MLFEPYVRFHSFGIKFGLLFGTYWEIAAHSA